MRITNINIPTTKHCPVLLKLTRLNFNGKMNENDIYSKTKNEHFEFLKKHLEKNHTAKAGLIFQSYKNQEISNEELLNFIQEGELKNE